MGFSRQEYWSGLSCPPPGDVPNPGTEPLSLVSPSLAGEFFSLRFVPLTTLSIQWSLESYYTWVRHFLKAYLIDSPGKASACNAGDTGDTGSIPGLGGSPGEGMTTHSSILAWRISWTEEPGGLQSMGSQRLGHNHGVTKSWT